MASFFANGFKRRVIDDQYCVESESDGSWESVHAGDLYHVARDAPDGRSRHEALIDQAHEVLRAMHAEAHENVFVGSGRASSRRPIMNKRAQRANGEIRPGGSAPAAQSPQANVKPRQDARDLNAVPMLNTFIQAVRIFMEDTYKPDIKNIEARLDAIQRLYESDRDAAAAKFEGVVDDLESETEPLAPLEEPSVPVAYDFVGNLTAESESRQAASMAKLKAHAESDHAVWPVVDAGRLPFVRRMQGHTNMEASKFSATQAPEPSAFPELEQAMIAAQLPLWLPSAQEGMQPAILDSLHGALEMLERITPDDMMSVLEPEIPKEAAAEEEGGGAPAQSARFFGARRAYRAPVPPSGGAVSLKDVLYAGGLTPESLVSLLFAALGVPPAAAPVRAPAVPPGAIVPQAWVSMAVALNWIPPPPPPAPPPPPPQSNLLKFSSPIIDAQNGVSDPEADIGVKARLDWAEIAINRLVSRTVLKSAPHGGDPMRVWIFHGLRTAQDLQDHEEIAHFALRGLTTAPAPCPVTYTNVKTNLLNMVYNATDVAGGAYTQVLLRRIPTMNVPLILLRGDPDLMDLYRELVSLELRLSDLRTLRSIESGIDRVRRTRAMETARSMVMCAWRTRIDSLRRGP